MADDAQPGELVGEEPVARLQSTVRAALKRKPTKEASVAGALVALAGYSDSLRELLVHAVGTLAGRGSFDRPLHAAGVRAAARLAPAEVAGVLAQALRREDAGELAEPLARVAASRHPLLAFAAEVARVARGESQGERVVAIAPKIKESHRIALCMEIFLPLLHAAALPPGVAPALDVLRGAERHLGRWLVLAEVASRAGDPAPLEEARQRAASGPSSARTAWGFVAWALSPGADTLPTARPTVEVVARLSDQPSADRDPTFLYRLAEAGAPTARPMLESLVKGSGLSSAQAVRAAMYLARHYGRDDLVQSLRDTARSKRREAVRGMAAALLYDLGTEETMEGYVAQLTASRQLPTLAWGGLIRAVQASAERPLVTEDRYRQVQLGWVQ